MYFLISFKPSGGFFPLCSGIAVVNDSPMPKLFENVTKNICPMLSGQIKKLRLNKNCQVSQVSVNFWNIHLCTLTLDIQSKLLQNAIKCQKNGGRVGMGLTGSTFSAARGGGRLRGMPRGCGSGPPGRSGRTDVTGAFLGVLLGGGGQPKKLRAHAPFPPHHPLRKKSPCRHQPPKPRAGSHPTYIPTNHDYN